MDYFVFSLLGLSLIGNAVLGVFLYKKKHIITTDAKALLSQILAGPTVVKIDVLDTSSLLIRSPRG